MHKSTRIGLFLIASLLVGTTVNMQMFVSNAVAQEYGQYPNSYQQSTYDRNSYSSDFSDKYSDYKTDDKKYVCQTGPFEGFYVSSVEWCELEKFDPPKEPKKFTCPDTGIVVDKPAHCPLICPEDTNLAGHLVAAEFDLDEVCDTDGAQFETCPAATSPVDPLNDLPGVKVTSLANCNIFDQCGTDTELPGVLVALEADQDDVCNPGIDGGGDGGNPATNFQAQCIKCADLATLASTGSQSEIAEGLIGSTEDNIFTVCNVDDDGDPRPGFGDLVDFPNAGNVEEFFDECLDNAAVNPGTGPSTVASPLQAQSMALQGNSFTTNVKPQSEISTSSSPSAQAQAQAQQLSQNNTQAQPQSQNNTGSTISQNLDKPTNDPMLKLQQFLSSIS